MLQDIFITSSIIFLILLISTVNLTNHSLESFYASKHFPIYFLTEKGSQKRLFDKIT